MHRTATRTAFVTLSLLAALGSGCAGQGHADRAQRELQKVVKTETRTDLEKFGSDAELAEYLAKLAKANERRWSKSAGYGGLDSMAMEDSAGAPAPSAAPMAEAEAGPADDGGGGDESITNTQEQGVDEGGIVKTHGKHLVVLRRGRLFTVDVGGDNLRPISMVDVAPAKGHDSWYDEMLIHDDKVIVVGYSYMAGATEIGIFSIDGNGQLAHQGTHFLRSNDYYSSRNYASRLVGDKFVFYMPYYLGSGWDAKNPNLPGVMHYEGENQRWDDWNQIIKASDIYRPIQPTADPVLHTVVTCDLDKGFSCRAQGIIGPSGRSFYVSREAVYVWVHDNMWDMPIEEDPVVFEDYIGEPGDMAEPGAVAVGDASGESPAQIAGDADTEPVQPIGPAKQVARRAPAAVYRLDLDGKGVGAVRTWGAPVDQFSFKESKDGHLNVLVRAEGAGDMMWGPEFAQGDVAMFRLPVKAFHQGVVTASKQAFTDLPDPKGDGYAFQNRFVGDYLLYGNGSGWGYADQATNGLVYAHPYAAKGRPTEALPIPHGVDRLEAMGNDEMVVGSNGADLHFTSLALGRDPQIVGEYVQPNANQGETRSHGFFFKPSGDQDGMVGLPVRRGSAPGYEHLMYGSAELLYLQVEDLQLAPMGGLASSPEAGQDDQCIVSCVDWYGNARPIFYRGRVFALLGYELVEGEVGGGKIAEKRRTDMLTLVRGEQPARIAQ